MSAVDASRPAAAPRRDLGRWVGVPVSLLLVTVSVLAVLDDRTHWASTSLLVHGHRMLVVAFYGLLLWSYVRRVAASAVSRSLAARLAAAVGTVLPAALPAVTDVPEKGWGLAIGSVVTLAGLSWSVVSLRTLGRAFSVMPEARTLVRRGPYAVVRHPLYLGELAATLGIVVSGPTAAAAGLWAALVFLQCYRADHEEHVLTAALPDYASYRWDVRSRVVPGVW